MQQPATMSGGDAVSSPRATPTTNNGLARNFAQFETLTAALDYAAKGATGFNFYAARGTLQTVLPYRDLRERAISLALKLSAAGNKPGDRVALLAATAPEFLTAKRSPAMPRK